MNTDEIDSILRGDLKTRKYYIGTFPCDQIPQRLPKRFLICVNTDDSSKGGSHWVALARMGSELWYFDSMGEAPPRRGPLWRFVRSFPRVIYNKVKHQSDSSSVCGGFSIFALCMFARGHTIREVIRLFASLDRDDEFISSFMYHVFRFKFSHSR